jgi:hypothetical protein
MLSRMLRRPLPWLLAAEAAVLLALGVAGWQLVASRLAPAPSRSIGSLALPAGPNTSARPASPAATPSPAATVASPRPAAAPPSLSTNPTFWQRNLSQLNREEAGWAAAEARAAQAVEDFTRAYVQRVVLPAVEAAAQPSDHR